MYWLLFSTFLKCGFFAFGGGTTAVVLIENEVVNNFSLLTNNEFADAYSVGLSLPGPIATKLAALAGYKMGGITGALIAVAGLVLPSATAIILLFSIYQHNKDLKWIQGMMRGIKPITFVLVLQLLVRTYKSAFGISIYDSKLTLATVSIAIIALTLQHFFGVNTIMLIILSLIFGGIFLS